MSRGARAIPGIASLVQERRLRSGILTGALLSILLGGLVLALPGLRGVSHSIRHARPGWVALAAGLEVASCLGYVLAFQGTFARLPRRFAALVAASEQAFGAVVPLGGAGGIAAGGWLLARRGIPVRRIAERSAVLFLLTSATNVVALLVAAGGLAADWFTGPHDVLRAGVPATVALAVLLVFAALAWSLLDRRLGSLSGGQASRAGLAALAVARFDVVLLDEPTITLTTTASSGCGGCSASAWVGSCSCRTIVRPSRRRPTRSSSSIRAPDGPATSGEAGRRSSASGLRPVHERDLTTNRLSRGAPSWSGPSARCAAAPRPAPTGPARRSMTATRTPGNG